MKKLIRIMLTLATTTTIPFSVVACGHQALDANLSTIYQGETNYLINDTSLKTGIRLNSSPVIGPVTLTTDVIQKLAQNISNTILDKAHSAAITWYDKDKTANQKCYNFNITNGTDVPSGGKQWDVNQSTQRITINISYLVGNADNAKNFKATQKIDMAFNIKVGTSAHDTVLANWITTFNGQSWVNNINNPINVDITDTKTDLPKTDVSWSDLNNLVIAASNLAINNAISAVPSWQNSNVVAWAVKGVGTVDAYKKIELTLNINYGDSHTVDGIAPIVDNFYLQFTKKS